MLLLSCMDGLWQGAGSNDHDAGARLELIGVYGDLGIMSVFVAVATLYHE
jgi:hypothetical protein